MKLPDVQNPGMKTHVFKTLIGGKYFISSENWPRAPRTYSIHRMNEDGTYTTIEFRTYSSRDNAVRAIKHLMELGRL